MGLSFQGSALYGKLCCFLNPHPMPPLRYQFYFFPLVSFFSWASSCFNRAGQPWVLLLPTVLLPPQYGQADKRRTHLASTSVWSTGQSVCLSPWSWSQPIWLEDLEQLLPPFRQVGSRSLFISCLSNTSVGETWRGEQCVWPPSSAP